MEHLTWIDILIVGVFLVSILIGLWRGLVREVVAIAIWIAAFWLASLYAEKLSIYLPDIIDNTSFALNTPEYVNNLRVIVAFVLIVIAVFIIGGVINFILKKLMNVLVLRGTDRMLGLLFGMVRACAIMVALVLAAAAFTGLPSSPTWQQSNFVRPFEQAAVWVVQKLPEGYASNFKFSAEV